MSFPKARPQHICASRLFPAMIWIWTTTKEDKKMWSACSCLVDKKKKASTGNMTSSFKRKPAFTLYVALLTMSVSYMAPAGRFLWQNNPRRQEQEKPYEQSASLPSPSPTAATNLLLEKEPFVPTSLPPLVIHNVTEALEMLMNQYSLEINKDERPKKSPPNLLRTTSKRLDSSSAHATLTTSNNTPTILSDFIDETTWEVKVPVHDQLDFAIIAHAKTGTTFLQSTWWSAHPEIHMPSKECRLMPQSGGAAKVVQLMHTLRKETQSSSAPALYGYKNPQDINRPRALVHFRDYFPKTRLVIGVRHPVWWFQSFYNYRIKRGGQLAPPETLVGTCGPENLDVCTDNANFHANLATFGLTSRSSGREKQLLATKQQARRAMKPALPNPIFLYDLSQLDAGRDARVAEALRQDLSTYLGLHTPLPPLVQTHQPPSDAQFSICEPAYQALRSELIRIGQAAGSWITEFFLNQPTVHVSSRDEFERLIGDWAKDPCE